MVNTGPGLNKHIFPFGQILLFSAFFLAPTLSPLLFGWLNGLLAVPVFYLFNAKGLTSGIQQLRISLLIAGIVALLMQRLEIFFFSLTLVPLGYALFKSVAARDSAAVSGGKGIVVLGLTWIFFWGIFGAVSGTNPYNSLLEALDTGFQQSLKFYASNEAGLSQDTVYALQQVTSGMKQVIPNLLPGLLAAALVMTVWINMVFSNALIARLCNCDFPWGKYSTWKLPEHLVWAPIAGIAIMLAGYLQYVGGWLVLLSGLLYFFQGLAVCIALQERWNIPIFIRVLLYFVLVIQSYGVLILTFLGMSDVWFNLRQIPEKE